MTATITEANIISLEKRFENHSVYRALKTQQDLCCFMEHHVFSVWSYMSLVKYLQAMIAPSSYPWVPRCDTTLQHFINELVLEEESGQGMQEGSYSSHFEIYQQAMRDIGAKVEVSQDFVDTVTMRGINAALRSTQIPIASKCMHTITFDIVNTDEPHRIAAALFFAYEHLMPSIFRSTIKWTAASAQEAPAFYHYLNRHTPQKEEHRRTLYLQILNRLCVGDKQKMEEALETANKLINARIQILDSVQQAIELTRGTTQKVRTTTEHVA